MFDNSGMYTAFELQRMVVSPINAAAEMGKRLFNSSLNPVAYTPMGRQLAAGYELVERFTRHFTKPEFNITSTQLAGEKKRRRVYESLLIEKNFGDLLHFKKAGSPKQPKILVVAPLSGHYSTLCRGTVEDLLPHYDVYITDWRNARDVPLEFGAFSLDDYINYLICFIEHLGGKDLHLLAVCQPAVPVMAAASIMATEGNPHAPASMTLIGGPIDTRKNPTEVNMLAEKKPYSWFEKQVVSKVPFNYPGYLRSVYPGFLQLSGFMTMNLDRHIEAHKNLFDHLVEGDGESVGAHKKFYNEYMSVMDIPAEFYLQTIKTVFQDHDLPRGKMISRNRAVRPQDITKTACLTIEGGRDDITGRGQTKAALSLLKNVPKKKLHHHLQEDVGHYGLFNGTKFREQILPVICDFTKTAAEK